MAFPTLTSKPVFPLPEGKEDNIDESPLKAGYTHRRINFTRVRKIIPVQYPRITAAEKATLDSWEDGEGQGPFSWTHPDSGTSYTVYIKRPGIAFANIRHGEYSAAFTLVQV